MPDVFTPPAPDEVLETSFTPPSPTDVEDSFTPPAPDEVEPLVSPEQREHILSGLVEAGKRGEKQPTVPVVQLPRATMTQGPFPGQKLPSVAQIAGGIYNALAAVPEFLSTPQGASTGMAAGLGGALGRVIAAGFSADLASHTPQQITELDTAIKSGDKMAISQKAAELGLSAAFIGATGKHAIKGPKVEASPIVKEEAAPAPAKEVIPVEETQKVQEEVLTPEPTVPAATTEQILGKAPEPIFYQAGTPTGKRRGVTYVADDLNVAKLFAEGGEFGRQGAQIRQLQGSPNIFELSKMEPQQAEAIIGKEAMRYVEPDGNVNFYAFENISGIKERLKDAGYNAIRISEGEGRTSIAILEPSILKEVKSSPAEPEIIGMGGATPTEFKPTSEKATSIKNASVDAERQSRGQEPIMAPTRLRNEVVWDKAMAKIDTDPAWQDRLIDEFKDNPRAATPEETVALDHRYVDLQNEYAKATRDGAQHYADGFELGVEEAKIRAAFFESKLNELEQVSRKIGTEAGRSLQMRQRLMKEDFSLAAMEAKMRAAKGFAPLSLAEHAEIKVLHDKLAAAEKNAFEIEQRANKRIALVEAQKALAEAKTQSGQVAYEPRIIAIAERFATYMDRKAEAASKRLKARLGRVSAGIDPTMLVDVGIVGAAKILRGAVDSAKWIDEMAAQFGDWIREHKDEAWAIANKTIDEDVASFAGGKELVEKVKRATGELARLTREKEDLQARLMLEDYSPRRAKQAKAIDKETADARAEVLLLREQFQRALAKENYKRKSNAEKVWLGTKEGLNLSRALMTSADLSAVLRQGGFITLGHPVLAAKSFGPMLRAAVSEKNAAAIEAEIRARPNANLYERSKLFIAPRDTALSGMEEAYMSKLARNIPGIAASQRAYVSFLNKLRADSFDQMYDSLVKGKEATQSELEAIGNYINVATGRGNLGKAAGAAETLSTVFFSPRLVASRLQLIAGQPLYRGSARTRYMVAKEYARFLVGIGAVYSLAKLAGAEVEDDSRSADFGKLRFGNTRVDPLAGLSQTTVLLSRLGSGETKNLRGKVLPIRGKVPYGASDSADVIARFLRTKLSPAVGTVVDVATGKNVVGEPVTAGSVAQNLTVPMALQDIYDVMEEQGIPKGTAIALLSILGMGVQNYEDHRKKR